MISGDFNGDGKVDVAVRSLVDHSISVYFGDGAGGFLLPATKVNAPQPAVGFAAGDLNHDGKTDLVVITQTTTQLVTISTELGDSPGNFTNPFTRNIPGAPGTQIPVPPCCAPFVTDFNRDGNPDLVLGSFGAAVLIGDGAGGFVQMPSLSLQYQLQAAADFDGDGLTDLLVYDNSSHLGVQFRAPERRKRRFPASLSGRPAWPVGRLSLRVT